MSDVRVSPVTQTVPDQVVLDHFDNLIWDVIYADRRTQAADRANYRDENEIRIEAWQKLQDLIKERCFGLAQKTKDQAARGAAYEKHAKQIFGTRPRSLDSITHFYSGWDAALSHSSTEGISK